MANAVIQPASQRMKADHPIAIDRSREQQPPGGAWAVLDPVARGRVQIIPAGENPISQAQAAVAELQRLSALDPDWDWARCAVVAREWHYLDPVRSLCEIEGISVQLANEEFSGVWRLRETQALLAWLRNRDSLTINCANLAEWLANQTPNPWVELLQESVAEYALENVGADTPTDSFIEWLAEWSREARRRQGGLLLLTAHRAKGLEFDHVIVLDGNWHRVGKGEDADASRRLYYVAMTRARQTLGLMRFPGPHPFQDTLPDDTAATHRREAITLPSPPLELARQYRRLSLRDVDLGFAGRQPSGHPVHEAIAALAPGDPLHIRTKAQRWELLDGNDTVVGRLANGFEASPDICRATATVQAIVHWNRESSDPLYWDRYRCDSWEVVVPELVLEH